METIIKFMDSSFNKNDKNFWNHVVCASMAIMFNEGSEIPAIIPNISFPAMANTF